MVAQLKKGVLEFCILQIVSSDSLYGYEIMKQITSIFPDTSEQTVYTILRRLLTDGYTSCFSKTEESVLPRKYYKITPAGTTYLAQCQADWNLVTSGVEKILKGKIPV